MADETVESLKKRLTKQQESHGQDIKRLRRMERAMEVLIAAGYLDRDRYQRAEALVDDFNTVCWPKNSTGE